MRKAISFCAVFLTGVFVSSAGHADYCPKKVAAFANGVAAKAYSRILQDVYKKQGCDLKIEFLPAKRGFSAFNRGDVDGELYRLSVSEKNYKTPFVRSEVALYQYRAGVWRHPNDTVFETRPLGYVRGMTWQVKYVNENPGLRAVQFNAPGEALEAFKRGAIGSFLSGEPMMRARLANDVFDPVPRLTTVLVDKPIYHYLHQKFAPFMKDFSDQLRNQNIFENVGDYF